MLSCCTPSYRAWSLVILLLDLTYSAFLLPITIGFQVRPLPCGPKCRRQAGLPGLPTLIWVAGQRGQGRLAAWFEC